MTHFHYNIVAYDEKTEGQGFTNVVEINIENAKDSEEAVEKAKKVIVKPGYYVRRVSECSMCDVQKENNKILKTLMEK